MMTAEALLLDLRSRGCRVRLNDGTVYVNPPSPETLTEADREALRRHKPALLQLLNAPRVADCGCVVWPDGCVIGPRACRGHGLYWDWPRGWGTKETA